MSGQLSDGQYIIESMMLSKKVLEVEGEKANDGTRVDLWQNNDKPHQRWQLTKVAEDKGEIFYVIKHPNSSMAMEAPGPWKQGDAIVLRDYEQGDDKRHRQWKLVVVAGQTNAYKIVNRLSGFVIDVEGGASGTKQIKQYASWPAPDDRQHWKLMPVTPGTKVPVVVELFQHPLGRPANHDWTINQRSVVLTQDTPYLNAGDHNRPNPISDFPTQVSAIKIHPGPDYDPRAQYEIHLFQGENYSGEYAIRTLALGEPNLHWQVGVGDNVHSVKFVTVPPVTLPATPGTKVPVVVELFQHPLGRPANHDWTINQRSVVLTQDTPYLNAGDHNRPNPISDFPTQVSAIKIHPGPEIES